MSLFERPTLQELEARSSLASPSPRLRGLAGLEQATGEAVADEPPTQRRPPLHRRRRRHVLRRRRRPGAMLAIGPPEHEALLDCGDDDYFNTDLPDGSYLARAWNTADSGFLYDHGAAAPARLALTGAATITWGGRVELRGRLTDQGTGAGLAGDPVNLIARPAGAGADQAAGTATSAADGGASFTVTPAATTTYRASFPGSDSHGIAGSPQVRVTVRPQLTARLQARTISRGRSVTVTGKVSPNHRGQRVYLERLVKGSWKGAASAVLTSASGYTLRATPSVRGRLTYRVRKRADSDHASAVAPTLTVTVR